VLFPTVTFALFFPPVLLGAWLLAPRPLRWKLFLLAASYVFYAWWNWRFCFLIAGSTVMNQVFAVEIARRRDEVDPTIRYARWAAVAANLAVLGWFKYYGFFVTSVATTLRDLGVDISPRLVQVALPVGISFFTFQALSYVFDVGRDVLDPAPLLDVAVYLAFFPHLVAGPIVRASEFLPQLRRRPDPKRVDSSTAFWLITKGLFKKVVIASYLSTVLVDSVFATPNAHSAPQVLAGIYGYAIQIYADFSGYTDIAIGLALLLGIRFPENFDRPYVAASLQEFWRRWHMTLSRWLRDYLYIPLGGNRRGARRTYVNLMLTMLLGGLWHGAAWTFVVWGGIHGVGLAVERRYGHLRAPRWVQQLVTFHIVCLAWVFFRAETFTGARDVLWRLVAGWTGDLRVDRVVVLTIVAALAVQFVPRDAGRRVLVAFSRLAPAAQAAALAGGLVVIDVLGPAGVAPFIYFRF
jgi:D-alanyl-lipoteichoic acid acyltransferase DltB (MBOAT superfamily)